MVSLGLSHSVYKKAYGVRFNYPKAKTRQRWKEAEAWTSPSWRMLKWQVTINSSVFTWAGGCVAALGLRMCPLAAMPSCRVVDRAPARTEAPAARLPAGAPGAPVAPKAEICKGTHGVGTDHLPAPHDLSPKLKIL